MNPILAVYQWLEVPHEVRLKLHEVFQLKKSSVVHVEQRVLNSIVQGILISDGHTQEDLLAITLPKLRDYTSIFDSEDFIGLFKEAVKKVDCGLKGLIYYVPDKISDAPKKTVDEIIEEVENKAKEVEAKVIEPLKAKPKTNAKKGKNSTKNQGANS